MKNYWLLMHLWKNARQVKAKLRGWGKETTISAELYIHFTFHLPNEKTGPVECQQPSLLV